MQLSDYKVLICLMGFFMLLNCSGKNNRHNEQASTASLQLVVKGLESPIEMGMPDDGSGRIFIAEQKGIIKIIRNGAVLATPFLDLRSKMVAMNDGYTEKGLLGFVFHPQYKSNGKFYVYYSAHSSGSGSDHKSVIAEFKVSATNPDKADLTERKILEIEQPEANHNGGHLAFGPDKYLYIGLGDGGGGGDEHGRIGNGQNLNTLLGKILRIDINKETTYSIPPDNPFVNRANTKPEIWAYGLRNPWKFTFDKNGRLFCADVGQNKYEEVNIIEKGKNYGWRIMEASHCFNPATNCAATGLTLPIYEYDHKVGISVTGGYFYTGAQILELQNKYVFADWTGVFFAITDQGKGGVISIKNKPNDLRVLSFGNDLKDELYVLTSLDTQPMSKTGALYKLVKSN
ncbi:PQQ-dependent sugar dehydrogenase [Solitalea sp. MAHUQ-68]|uniref:PQQ-dependent sugar dehydrogenase n=1 Tax=Solitalea agri TaxID=2953739 RepID=A0A9X2F2K8_9SPHI|nr:PQQ-dependent sugar dehydrogenase [Solitalea agri]MCO4293025.1 PQQ-dependent sugar dehydrogenase [Solitalea agri]